MEGKSSWRVKLSQEKKNMHVVGQMSMDFTDWEGTTRDGVRGVWVADNNRSFANGNLVESKAIFKEGETVKVILDRRNCKLTVEGLSGTATIPGLPAEGPLYPAVAFTSDKQYSKLLDYKIESAPGSKKQKTEKTTGKRNSLDDVKDGGGRGALSAGKGHGGDAESGDGRKRCRIHGEAGEARRGGEGGRADTPEQSARERPEIANEVWDYRIIDLTL